MTLVHAYAATSATGPLGPARIERRPVGPHDVRIDIRYSGICHSDIHTVRGDWGPIEYPQVVGHEIAGVVAEVGSAVTRHRVGDRVGVGCLIDSCGECRFCSAGEEQYCTAGCTLTYGSLDADGKPTQGGYATGIVVKESFVVRIPGALDLAAAAPLLCAGVTTYSPLAHWRVGAGTRVAIVGMGGLGHLAVKIAKAKGAHVTVLSHGTSKRDDAMRFGADAFHATSDPATFRALGSSFDFILNTVSADIDINSYLGLLDVDGTLTNVGAPGHPMPVQVFRLIGKRRSFAGSAIGGIRETQEMLDFCAEHGIAAEIELIEADAINDAYERVLNSDVRYRFVIDAATFAPDAA
ncbi:MAG TPA: NAD(P)-dependent alcohol dehydrogenase [Microbacteriaceae bacterium]|nr:NAD(P)-dependent alcohol dehydrogenase [Microbacteriaceae bacterium]